MASNLMSEIAKHETQLLLMFPNEVWEMVFENVNDALDYLRISSACSYFHSRLFSRAPQILYPEIFKLMVKQKTYKKLLTWIHTRQVCRTWKTGVDKMLQTQEYFTQRNGEMMNDMDGIVCENKRNDVVFPVFSSANDFTKFEIKFDSTHLANNRNPFLRRKVELYIPWSEPLESYIFACLQFLNNYGHHIWYCIVDVQGHCRMEFYNRRLKSILKRMPNLRALHIAPASVKVNVASASLPTLPHLEYMCFNGVPCVIVKELLQKNSQVLYVDAKESQNPINDIFETLLTLKAVLISISDKNELNNLKRAQFTSQVERLWVNASRLYGVSSKKLFQVLESKFSQSLIELHLSLPGYRDPYSKDRNLSAETVLSLPDVKTLFLEMEQPDPLEFLLGMKDTLEELHIAVVDERKLRKLLQNVSRQNNFNKVVYSFWKQPEKSGVWKNFPKLKFFQTKIYKEDERVLPEVYCCSRHERDIQ